VKLPATAVVFCGGRSSRMGRDKALLDWHGRPLALHVATRISPLFEHVAVSGDPARYGRFGFPCIPDRGGAGPLAGLYASLFEARTAAVFAIACDMPFARLDAIEQLWERLRGFDAAAPVTAHGPEPLHAFYSKRVLPAVGRALGGRASMPSWWGECAVAHVPAGALPGGEGALVDCDTEEDYERAHELPGPRLRRTCRDC
jgi:molybdopterin-guanine dinucleotide biosynthesis protein A